MFESKLYIYIYIYIFLLVPKFGRNFDQTSTPVSKCCRVLVETSTKLRPNLDTPSVEVWSKLARYMNEAQCKVKVFDKMPTKLQNQTSTKLLPNFDTPRVEVCSKFLPNFYQSSTLRCRSLVKLWRCVGQNCEYLFFKIVDTC